MGTACQLVPSPGQRQVRQDCWISRTTLGDAFLWWRVNLCRFTCCSGEVIETGTCTKNCSPDCALQDGGVCRSPQVLGSVHKADQIQLLLHAQVGQTQWGDPGLRRLRQIKNQTKATVRPQVEPFSLSIRLIASLNPRDASKVWEGCIRSCNPACILLSRGVLRRRYLLARSRR